MKNRFLMALVSGVVIISIAGGVVMAQEQNDDVKPVENTVALVKNVETAEKVVTIQNVNSTEKIEETEEVTPENPGTNNIFGCHGFGFAGGYNEQAREDMIKFMEENGLEEMAELMRNGDYQSMGEFMRNLSQEDYEKMLNAMGQEGFNQVPRMMQWGGRRGAGRQF